MQVMSVFTCVVALLSVGRVNAGQCCFSGRNDCDSERSFCSKDAKHCTDCGGSYHETNREAMACEGTGMCCYSDAKDCDMGKHWCSSSIDHCLDCGGDYACVKAEEKAESQSDADDETASHSQSKAQPVMLAASAPAEKPVMLASAAGKCCYSGPKDCDSERDWCSKDATHCDKCKGTFYNATDLDLAEVPPVMLAAMPPSAPVMLASAPGKCCYSGPKDCDSEKDWCSKDATHCGKCQGTFYNATDLDLAEVAEPVMLAAEVPKVPNRDVPGHCCYSGRNDCDGSRDWCSKDESHCTNCGGTFHADVEAAPAAPSKDAAVAQMAALPLDLAAVPAAHTQQVREPRVPREQHQQRQQRPQRAQAEQAEQPEQPEERAQGQQGGDWERFIPQEYRTFFKSKQEDAHRHAPRNQTVASSAKASAFLGAPQESLAADPFSLPALACLSVVGLALVMKAAVRANRRTVNLQTEVLG